MSMLFFNMCSRIAVAMLCIVALSEAASGADNANSKVFSVNSEPHGASYEEWSARHWQWLFSLPVDQHPLFDTADCSEGQTGNVWFLGGTFASIELSDGTILGEVDRSCTIPSGTALFFPLINAEGSEIEGNGTTERELRDYANLSADFIDPESVFLEINGTPVTGLESHREETDLFTFGPLPENNILEAFGLDAPAGTSSVSVGDGYFALVKPLPVGTHTLRFGGIADFTSVDGPLFIQDITYTITVVRRGQYQR